MPLKVKPTLCYLKFWRFNPHYDFKIKNDKNNKIILFENCWANSNVSLRAWTFLRELATIVIVTVGCDNCDRDRGMRQPWTCDKWVSISSSTPSSSSLTSEFRIFVILGSWFSVVSLTLYFLLCDFRGLCLMWWCKLTFLCSVYQFFHCLI